MINFVLAIMTFISIAAVLYFFVFPFIWGLVLDFLSLLANFLDFMLIYVFIPVMFIWGVAVFVNEHVKAKSNDKGGVGKFSSRSKNNNSFNSQSSSTSQIYSKGLAGESGSPTIKKQKSIDSIRKKPADSDLRNYRTISCPECNHKFRAKKSRIVMVRCPHCTTEIREMYSDL